MNCQNDGHEDQLFFDDERNYLTENYKKSIRGEESKDTTESQRAQNILYTSLILYTVALISFVLLLYYHVGFRFYCFEQLKQISQNGSLTGAILIGLVGFVLVLTGFNVVLYDVIAGFLLKPFWYGLLVVSLAKFIAKYTGFCLGRYYIRSFIYKAMNQNIYFITCYLAAERKPVKLMFSIQFMAIPTLFKSFACGLFRMSHWQFCYPTIFGTVLWGAFWVYIGNQLDSIIGTLQTGNTSSFVPWYIELFLGLVIILILVYFFYVTNNIYNDIKADIQLDKLSEIIDREEKRDSKKINQDDHID